MSATRYGSLPFKEQIEFFRQKVNLGTDAWTDIWEGMHSRAFVVAGARGDVLTDMRSAVERAIEQGQTLEDFRQEFDQIVQRTGWAYNGGRNWRTRVIYDTNLRQSYNAGREQQMEDPELRKARPYGLYRHGGSQDPREEHLSWDSLVLPLDHPWWETFSPSNGFGCTCKKFMLSQRDVERMGLKVAQEAPSVQMEEKTVGIRGPSPRTVEVPKGLDPGFAYNPGSAAWGRQLSQDAMEQWREQGAAAWVPLTNGRPQDYGRPDRIPFDTTQAKLGRRYQNQDDVVQALTRQLGGEEKVYRVGDQSVLINAQTLGRHIDPNRSEFLPLLAEALEHPFEVWATFERHQGTGKVVMRSRLIKAMEIPGRKGKGVVVVAQAKKGFLEALTFIPTSRLKELEKRRRGILVFGRDEE